MDKDLAIVAIIALVILECAALFAGINGTVFTLVIGAIAGIAGYEIGKAKEQPPIKK